MKLRPDAADEITLDGDLTPLIAPASYEAVIAGYGLGRIRKFGSPSSNGVLKLRIDFNVMIADGQWVTLPAFYNVDQVGKRLRVGQHSRYARDWSTVTGRRPSRRDRMAPSALVDALVKVTVRTVTKGYRATVNARGRREPEPLSEVNQYSVVDRIDELLAGGHKPR